MSFPRPCVAWNTNNSKKAGRDVHEPSSPGTEQSLVRACNKEEGKPPPISDTLMRRRLQFAGHCLRAESEIYHPCCFGTKGSPDSHPKDDVPANIIEELGHLGRRIGPGNEGPIPASDAEGV